MAIELKLSHKPTTGTKPGVYRGRFIEGRSKPKVHQWVVGVFFNGGFPLYCVSRKMLEEEGGMMLDSELKIYTFVESMRKFCKDREFEYHYYGADRVRFSFKHKQDAEFFILAWMGRELNI